MAGFTVMAPESTGLAFTNPIPPSRHYTNQILLHGSGVTTGDVDGDGWCDVFLAGLGGSSALFRNEGNWKFRNITAEAGLGSCAKLDATGTALADVDGDGDLDLTWVRESFYPIVDAMRASAAAASILIEWGGDWKTFVDMPHWQLPWSRYP